MVTPSTSQNTCTCDGFCSGRCSLPCEARPAENLTLFRLTPTNITDLVNKDTGDAEGDLFFTLAEYDLPLRCINGSSTNARGCFLFVSDIYIQFSVEVDGKYGPYGHCNPPHQNSLLGNFSCSGMGHGRPPHNTSQYCVCPRTNHTVGKQRVSMQFGSFGGWISKLSSVVDGLWYSTPAMGRCPDGAALGTAGCSWRLVAKEKAVNASCVQQRIYSKVEKENRDCFRLCPGGAVSPPDRRDKCVVHCFQQATLKYKAADLLAPWNEAFADDGTGCPPCRLGQDGVYRCQ